VMEAVRKADIRSLGHVGRQ